MEYLKSVRRKEVAEKVEVTLSFGDLSENSEYDETRNDQVIMRARIADTEVMLKNMVVIDGDELGNEDVHASSKMEARVTPEGRDSSIKEYRIASSNEANPLQGKASDGSAVGKVLLGRGVDDKAEVKVPVEIIHYEILAISK